MVDQTKATATWTDPTQNTDGSALAAGEITGYTVGVRDTSAALSVAGTYPFSATVPGAASNSELLSLLTPALPVGKPLAAAVRANTAALDAAGKPISSAWSTEADFTLTPPAPVPSAPTGFSVA